MALLRRLTVYGLQLPQCFDHTSISHSHTPCMAYNCFCCFDDNINFSPHTSCICVIHTCISQHFNLYDHNLVPCNPYVFILFSPCDYCKSIQSCNLCMIFLFCFTYFIFLCVLGCLYVYMYSVLQFFRPS